MGAITDFFSSAKQDISNAFNFSDLSETEQKAHRDKTDATIEQNAKNAAYYDSNKDNGPAAGLVSAPAPAAPAPPPKSTPFDPNSVLEYAKTAGMVESDAQIAELLADPTKWLNDRSINLSDVVPNINPETIGTNLNPYDTRYGLGDDVEVDPSTAVISTSGDVTPGPITDFTADTVTDRMGTDVTTVNPAKGTIREDNLVDAAQIDMQGAGTGVNADGTISVTGEALNNFATQDISQIIDTSTISGKLLAQKLGEGNYTDSKATVLGQMKIISDEFKDSNGNPVIPPWAQALARDTSRSMAFNGITGTAQTAAISTAIMEATLGVAEKDAAFFSSLTIKNLDNRQQSIINKASVMANFELANLDTRQASLVQNAKSFLEIDMANLTNEQQAEVINTQAMIEALFSDQTATNAQRLFSAETANDFQKYYDQMNTTISMNRSEQVNSMNRFNAGEINDASEFNSTMEDARQRFYASMQYNIDLANAKWRQTVSTTNSDMQFEAHSTDVKNTLDISTEAMNRMWDRVDNMLDYIYRGAEAESTRDANILAAQLTAQASGGSSKSGKYAAIGTIIAAGITKFSDIRLKENIEHLETQNGIRYYTWDWNEEAIRRGLNNGPTFGVMAQEVQKTHPEAIVEGPHGFLMVNYGALPN